jgi:hypothetical protein
MSKIVKTDKQKSYLARIGALTFMGREPDETILATIEKLDVPVFLYYYKVAAGPPMGKQSQFLLPYTAFAKGYSSILKGDYKKAFTFFSKMSHKRPEGYFAFAVAKSEGVDIFKQRYMQKSPLPKYPSYMDFNKLVALMD